jgi:hypothetical protein
MAWGDTPARILVQSSTYCTVFSPRCSRAEQSITSPRLTSAHPSPHEAPVHGHDGYIYLSIQEARQFKEMNGGNPRSFKQRVAAALDLQFRVPPSTPDDARVYAI